MAISPLFDIFDPSGSLRQRAMLGLPGEDEEDIDVYGAVPVKRRPQISDLMPEEEQKGLLSKLAQVGSSGLATAGYILDTPGAFVRGLLAGKPLSVFGDSEDRVTGRELLRQYGLIGNKDTWGNFGWSLAAEAALDPLSYLNPLAILGRGSLTKLAGEPLKKAGLLRDAAVDAARGFQVPVQRAGAAGDALAIAGDTVPRIAGEAEDIARYTRDPTGLREYLRNLTPEQAFREAREKLTPEEYADALARFEAAGGKMDAPAAGLMSAKIPFAGVQYDISGGAFGDALARGLDYVGENARYAPVLGPIVRTANAAFSPAAGYTLDPIAQDAHRAGFANARRNKERVIREMSKLEAAAMGAKVPEFADIGGQQVPIPQELRGFTPQVQNAIADWIESGGAEAQDQALSIPGSPNLQRSSGDPIADWVLSNVPEFARMRDSLAGLGPSAREAARSRALKQPVWASRFSNTNFFPRQVLWFDQDLPPLGVAGKQQKAYTRGDRLFSTADNFGRSRQLYTDLEGGRRTFRELTAGPDARTLQSDLLAAGNDRAPEIIDQWFASRGRELPYQKIIDDAASAGGDVQAARNTASALKVQLADLLRSADTQYADKGVGIFDTPAFTDALRYSLGQAEVSGYSDELINQLLQRADETPASVVAGGTSIPLSEAADRLGFDVEQFKKLFQQAKGSDITNFSVDKKLVDSLGALAKQTQLGVPESAAMNALNSFTRIWKAGALAWPSFHTRNAYSNILASLAQGNWDPFSAIQGYRASKGNYAPVAAALRDAPIYKDLADDAARAKRFLADSAEAGVGQGTILDDAGVVEQGFAGLYPGASDENNIARAARELLGKKGRTWGQFLRDFGTVRGVGISRPAKRTQNPILRLNDAVGGTVEDTSRVGMLINLLKKGYSPAEAGDMIKMALVDYSPTAFTAVERDLLKNALPFYSFQKGASQALVDNLLYRPGGVQTQGIRAVNRASDPSGDTMVPEYLRKTASIPLPPELGGTPKEGLQRFLTKIDPPWESTLNLFTPGVGSSTSAALMDTIRKTGSNLLGMTNPLIKAPIEYITDRQLYSGRNLSDLYSVLEPALGPMGQPVEQAIVNFVPFGSRALSLYRQLNDDRLDPLSRYAKALFNTFSGLSFRDEDIERTKQLAARDMLNQMLSSAPGVRTYENITVPPEVLQTMPAEQKQMYLLYKIIQSEAAKRAREKKKQQAALDPLQVLGVVQN